VTVTNTIIAFSTAGASVHCGQTDCFDFSCCDIYGNADGDWIEGIADQCGINGNICLDPCFCDAANGDLYLWDYSPCADEGCVLIGAWSVGCWDQQSADGRGERISSGTVMLLSAAPNPFLGSTRIGCAGLAAADAVLPIRVYDTTGRLVRTLAWGTQFSEVLNVVWDGRDQRMRPVTGGAYYARLRVGEHELVARLLRLR
jgi:hypothetical protein